MNYIQTVASILKIIPPGKQVSISDIKIVKEHGAELFIRIASSIITKNWDNFGWRYCFSNDYSKVKRNESNFNETFEKWLQIEKKSKLQKRK
ncbi:MAG: hypothetical protein PF486_05265 [Prolixibacteraceae bacterium]|jgi:hypothetical protein|nr:hypothetical protein [Prolixibacteraceae bacterium]